MVSYLLGIDVGTTGCKSMLFSSHGTVVAHAYCPYETGSAQRGFREQNCQDWWNAVVQTTREVCSQVAPSQVVGISLSTQGGTLAPVDERFQPIRPAIVWSDSRCTREVQEFSDMLGKDTMYQTTGWSLGANLAALQIRWLKNNEPENFQKTRWFLSVPDYIAAKMTGIPAIDGSNAGINQLMSLSSGSYDPKILDFCGITREQLPRICHSGERIGCLTPAAAFALGLTTETVVTSGAHDQYAVALGAGALDTGDILIGSGTSWVITAISDRPLLRSGLAISQAAVPGKWGALQSLSNGGVCLEWLRKNIASGQNTPALSYEQINEACAQLCAWEKGLYFFPFGGKLTDAPLGVWGNGTGTFIGMDLSDNQFALARAIMEGVVFQTAWLLERFEDRSDRILLAGGASKSPVWTQILADITGRTVLIPEVADLACVGAAILAGIGSGVFANAGEGYRNLAVNVRSVAPNAARCTDCSKALENYKRIAKSLGEIYGN